MKLEIADDDIGLRIDKFLRKILVNASLSYVFKILRTRLKVNGKKVKQGYRIKEGDIVELAIKEDEFRELASKDEKIRSNQIRFQADIHQTNNG